jgi:hypothetical protein
MLLFSNCVFSHSINFKNLTQSNKSDFKYFWIEFRQAVINNDTNKIVEMSHIPLKIRGEMNGDIIICKNKEDFMIFFKKFLFHQSFFVDGKFMTNFEYINNTDSIPISVLSKDPDKWKRVEDLVFEKIDDVWKLTLFYFPYNHYNDGKESVNSGSAHETENIAR